MHTQRRKGKRNKDPKELEKTRKNVTLPSGSKFPEAWEENGRYCSGKARVQLQQGG